MCKLFAAAGIQPEYTEHMWRLLEKLTPIMTRANDDGFGYAALTGTELWGERWYDVHYAHKVRRVQVPVGYERVLKGSNVGWNAFGQRPTKFTGVSAPINALIAHARRAAGSPKSPANVHPFVKDNTALIHNGVVTQFSKDKLNTKGSDDCDSMGLLNRYLEHSSMYDISLLEKAYEDVSGGMVCVVLAHDGQRWVMDLWKNDYNTFYAVKLKDGKKDVGIVWTTDKDDVAGAIASMIESDKAKYKDFFPIASFAFEAGNALRIDATTGGFVAHAPFPKETYARTGTSYQMGAGGGSSHAGIGPNTRYFPGGGRELPKTLGSTQASLETQTPISQGIRIVPSGEPEASLEKTNGVSFIGYGED